MRLITKCHQRFCVSIDNMKHLAKPNFLELKDRTIFIIEGNDTEKFLQGITTNNVNLLYPEKYPQLQSTSNRISMYTMFLNPKGKIITDALIIRPKVFSNGQIVSKNNQLWVETDKHMSETLEEHLKRYSWKKKSIFIIYLISRMKKKNLNFLQDFHPYDFKNQKMMKSKNQNPKQAVMFRVKANLKKQLAMISMRILLSMTQEHLFLELDSLLGLKVQIFKGEKIQINPKEYDFFEKTFGIASGKTMRNRLPFMFNADILNGFSFNKGCYLGQQIVSRSYFTGIVRRRVFPFVSVSEQVNLKEGQAVYDEQDQEIGKVVEPFAGGGLILINYLSMLQKFPIKIKSPAEGMIAMPFEEQLKSYVEQMRKKQDILSQIDL